MNLCAKSFVNSGISFGQSIIALLVLMVYAMVIDLFLS